MNDGLTLREQHREIDKYRTTAGLDIPRIKEDARALFELRRISSGEEFERRAKAEHPNFISKYPQFYMQIKDEDGNRIDESLEVMNNFFNMLAAVQQGKIDHEQMRDAFFERDLASRYYHGKTGSRN